MLWDYGGREAEILGPAAVPATGPAKQPKKKKGGGATAVAEQPESPARTNGRAAPPAAEAPLDDAAPDGAFGGAGEGSMPPAMGRWCQEQMLTLTGNDDTTLTHFLFSLEVRTAAHLGAPRHTLAPRTPLTSQAYARAPFLPADPCPPPPPPHPPAFRRHRTTRRL